MPFHSRGYSVVVILGSPTVPPLWEWPAWQRIVPALDPLMTSARGKTSVRSSQLDLNEKRELRFGRLGWDARSHQKWAHRSPTTDRESGAWHFMATEVWSPSWTVCEREMLAPDVFFGMSNQVITPGRVAGFNPLLVLAIAQDRSDLLAHASSAVACLRAQTRSALALGKVRTWGQPSGASGYTSGISDLLLVGLFKPGFVRDSLPDLDQFAEDWVRVNES